VSDFCSIDGCDEPKFMDSLWTEVEGWPDYFVSDSGLVSSSKPRRNYAKAPETPRELSQKTDRYGYKVVRLYNKEDSKYLTVHTLVLTSFTRAKKEGEVCRHLDGNRQNNWLGNLRWGSPKENSQDAKSHGTLMKGGGVNTARLTEEQVLQIRGQIDICFSSLSREFGVTPSTIRNAYLGITWSHLN
jgi:hypothetical protein